MAIIRLQGRQEKEAGVYYEVDTASAPIGEGGMGKVYRGKAVNTKTGVTRTVAIKVLFMDLPEQAIERARREASIRLRNDNLVEMLGFIETEEDRNGAIVKHYHVVSELLHGVSLADIIQGKCTDPNGVEIPYARELMTQFKEQPDEFAKTIIKAALSGLMALHDAGYIHRDIDPSNIFITDDKHIKLIDFGIAKQMNQLATDKQLTVSGAFMGKPEYASPELALGDLKFQNQTTDIYAMGVLLYQCITGNVPFEGTRFDVLDKQVKEKLPVKEIQNKELKRIIGKATEKRQELRYQTAAEMRVDLESLDVKRALDPKKKRLYIIISILAAVAIVGAALGTVFHSKRVVALEEKNYTDSLSRTVDMSLKFADSLTRIGMAHGEGYYNELIMAKQCYVRARNAVSKLQEKNIQKENFDAKENQLNGLLKTAASELKEKSAILKTDNDPVVLEEAKKTDEKVQEIEQLLN